MQRQIIVRGIDKEATGKRIQKMMRIRNIDVNEVSSMLGLTYQCVYRWTKGSVLPDLENMLALCEILGVRVEALVVRCGDEPEKDPAFEERIAEYGYRLQQHFKNAA